MRGFCAWHKIVKSKQEYFCVPSLAVKHSTSLATATATFYGYILDCFN